MKTIKNVLLTLCATVEKQVAMAIRSVSEGDKAMARRVMSNDAQIDRIEVELEESCLKALALYQPVAVDLRELVAVLKINNDLERIGDLAVNIAERACCLADGPNALPGGLNLDSMGDNVRAMLKKAVDAFVEGNSMVAREVCGADDEVDAMNKDVHQCVVENVRGEHADVSSLILLLSASRDLERIADHATNIAEDVIYMMTGEIVRHHVKEYNP